MQCEIAIQCSAKELFCFTGNEHFVLSMNIEMDTVLILCANRKRREKKSVKRIRLHHSKRFLTITRSYFPKVQPEGNENENPSENLNARKFRVCAII